MPPVPLRYSIPNKSLQPLIFSITQVPKGIGARSSFRRGNGCLWTWSAVHRINRMSKPKRTYYSVPHNQMRESVEGRLLKQLQERVQELEKKFSKIPVRFADMESSSSIKILHLPVGVCMSRDYDYIDTNGQQYLAFGGDTPPVTLLMMEQPNDKLDFSIEGNTIICPGHDFVEGLALRFYNAEDDKTGADMPLGSSTTYPTPTKLTDSYLPNGGGGIWYVHNPDTVAGTFELEQGLWNTGIFQAFDVTLHPTGQSIGQVNR